MTSLPQSYRNPRFPSFDLDLRALQAGQPVLPQPSGVASPVVPQSSGSSSWLPVATTDAISIPRLNFTQGSLNIGHALNSATSGFDQCIAFKTAAGVAPVSRTLIDAAIENIQKRLAALLAKQADTRALYFDLVATSDSLGTSTERNLPTAIRALEFYSTIPDALKSDLLWEIVAAAFQLGISNMIVLGSDDGTTVDVSSPGRLLSVLIDRDVCLVSSFSRRMELKFTYDLAEGHPRDELIEVIKTQLRQFQKVAVVGSSDG